MKVLTSPPFPGSIRAQGGKIYPMPSLSKLSFVLIQEQSSKAIQKLEDMVTVCYPFGLQAKTRSSCAIVASPITFVRWLCYRQSSHCLAFYYPTLLVRCTSTNESDHRHISCKTYQLATGLIPSKFDSPAASPEQ